MNIAPSRTGANLLGAAGARRIFIFLLAFLFIQASAERGVAAQDLPAAQIDAAIGIQSNASPSEEPTNQGSERQGTSISSTDAVDSSVSQDPPADPQTKTASTQSQSSRRGNEHFIHDLVGDFFHDQYRIWTGPFRAQSYDSHVMKKYGIPFLIITGTLIATDHQTAHWFANSHNQDVWSGRVSQIGAPYTVAGISAATYLFGRTTNNQHARETGFLALEAVADSQFITLVLKEVTQRQRPLDGPRNGGFFEGGTSFPSGHASGSFAVAAVFAYEYRDHIAIPIAADWWPPACAANAARSWMSRD